MRALGVGMVVLIACALAFCGYTAVASAIHGLWWVMAFNLVLVLVNSWNLRSMWQILKRGELRRAQIADLTALRQDYEQYLRDCEYSLCNCGYCLAGFAQRRQELAMRFAAQGLPVPPAPPLGDIQTSAERYRLAEERATNLLVEHLTPQQRQQFDIERLFDVVGSDGEVYTITSSSAFNVHRNGVAWCGYPYVDSEGSPIPMADRMLGQKLLIESDIDAFKNVANTSFRY